MKTTEQCSRCPRINTMLIKYIVVAIVALAVCFTIYFGGHFKYDAVNNTFDFSVLPKKADPQEQLETLLSGENRITTLAILAESYGIYRAEDVKIINAVSSLDNNSDVVKMLREMALSFDGIFRIEPKPVDVVVSSSGRIKAGYGESCGTSIGDVVVFNPDSNRFASLHLVKRLTCAGTNESVPRNVAAIYVSEEDANTIFETQPPVVGRKAQLYRSPDGYAPAS